MFSQLMVLTLFLEVLTAVIGLLGTYALLKTYLRDKKAEHLFAGLTFLVPVFSALLVFASQVVISTGGEEALAINLFKVGFYSLILLASFFFAYLAETFRFRHLFTYLILVSALGLFIASFFTPAEITFREGLIITTGLPLLDILTGSFWVIIFLVATYRYFREAQKIPSLLVRNREEMLGISSMLALLMFVILGIYYWNANPVSYFLAWLSIVLFYLTFLFGNTLPDAAFRSINPFRFFDSEILGVSLVSGIILIVLSVTLFFSARETLERYTVESHYNLAVRISEKINDFIYSDALTKLKTAAVVFPSVRSSDRETILRHILSENDFFAEVAGIGTDGKEKLKINRQRKFAPEELKDQKTSAAYAETARGRDYVSRPYTQYQLGSLLDVAVPVKDSTGIYKGTLTGQMSLRRVWDLVYGSAVGRRGYVFVVDDQGNILVHPQIKIARSARNLAKSPVVMSVLRGIIGKGEFRNEMGERVIGAYTPVKGLGWGVIVEEPITDALIPITMMQAYSILIVGVFCLITFSALGKAEELEVK